MRRHKAEEGAEQRNSLLKRQIAEPSHEGGLPLGERRVRERQYVLLRILVELRIGELAVALALSRLVRAELREHAVREALVTAKIKAETVVLDRLRGARPLGTAVRDQKEARQLFVRH